MSPQSHVRCSLRCARIARLLVGASRTLPCPLPWGKQTVSNRQKRDDLIKGARMDTGRRSRNLQRLWGGTAT